MSTRAWNYNAPRKRHLKNTHDWQTSVAREERVNHSFRRCVEVALRDRQGGNLNRRTMSLFRQRKLAYIAAIAKQR